MADTLGWWLNSERVLRQHDKTTTIGIQVLSLGYRQDQQDISVALSQVAVMWRFQRFVYALMNRLLGNCLALFEPSSILITEPSLMKPRHRTWWLSLWNKQKVCDVLSHIAKTRDWFWWRMVSLLSQTYLDFLVPTILKNSLIKWQICLYLENIKLKFGVILDNIQPISHPTSSSSAWSSLWLEQSLLRKNTCAFQWHPNPEGSDVAPRWYRWAQTPTVTWSSFQATF